jgi:phosphatidate cytidylyltransferase
MTWHLIDYERGAHRSATDYAVSLAGIVYLGWIGGYLVLLRGLPDGEWWVLVALPTVWIADSAAYLIGTWKGRRPLTPRLSPKKTWEGYLAGAVTGAAVGAGLAALWRIGAGPGTRLTPLSGLVVGGLIAVVSPLGDLGISMIKREMKVKDTGTLFAAHGGALDRVDSWLWAGVLGYYAVGWLTGSA